MRQRALLPLICHASAAAILGCAFVIVSLPHIWAGVHGYHFGPMRPFHTTNGYMVSLLKVQNGSERLERTFSTLPQDKPLAVLLHDGSEEGIFLGYLVSYFAWPREVRSIPVTRTNAANQLRTLNRSSLGALFFCGIDPPPGMQPRIPIGANLVMVPSTPQVETAAP